MCGCQRHAQAATGEHHHDLSRRGFFRQIFGVSGKSHAGIIDDAFVHRRRHHRGKLAATAAVQRPIQQLQHVTRIGRVELPRM